MRPINLQMNDIKSELSRIRETQEKHKTTLKGKKNKEHMLYLDLKKYAGQVYMR